jgi:hypothetical protein
MRKTMVKSYRMYPILRTSIFIILISLGLIACSRTVAIQSPSFSISSTSTSKVEKAIKLALVQRGWSVVSQTRDEIIAEYEKGHKHTVEISIKYSRKEVTISYRGSSGLLYGVSPRSGEPVIHKNYNRWVTFLSRDIQRNLSVL